MVARLSDYISTIVMALIVLATAFIGEVAAAGKNQGATYYVSPAGADTNLGTQKRPLGTLRKACARVQPGDTIVLLAGVYREAPFTFTVNGTADKPITIRAATAGSAILTYPTSGPKMEAEAWPNPLYTKTFKSQKVVVYKSVAELASSHIRLRGIVFEGWRDKTDALNIWAACSGIEVGAVSDVVFQQCTFRGNGHCGIKLGGPVDIRFEDCLICDNGTTGYDHGIYINYAERLTLRRNVFQNNQGIGIKCAHDNPNNLTIEDNVVHHNGEGILIEGHEIVVRHNVFAWNGRKDSGKEEPLMGGLIFRGPTVANNRIEENTFIGNATELCFDTMGKGFGKGNIVRKNVFYSQPLDLETGGVASPNYLYKSVLTDEDAITESRRYGIVCLTKTADSEQQLRSDLKEREVPAAFGSVKDADKYQFVFEGNIFKHTSRLPSRSR